MIKKLLLFFAILMLAGCSFSTPKNKWQLNSVNAFTSYEEYFLKGKESIANVELKRAKNYAKQSADLMTLARIELSSCALHVSVLQSAECKEYESLKPLVPSKELEAYNQFLAGALSELMVDELPSRYQNFARYVAQKEYGKAQNALDSMDNIVSKMLAASLIKKHLYPSTVKNIINESSFYGYKKAVIAWTKFYINMNIENNEKKKMLKILEVIDDSK